MQSKRFIEFPISAQPTLFSSQIEKILILSKSLQFIPLNKNQKQNIFHTQFLKSSLFSARIEGNQLTLVQTKKINLSNPKEKNRKEVSNILKSLTQIKNIGTPFSLTNLLDIHQMVMSDLIKNPGKLRNEASAIFDQYGTAIYLTPNPDEMKKMLDTLIKQINQPKHSIGQQICHIANCHYYFEKIHPFLDGNGRVGRIIMQYMLNEVNLMNDFNLPIEEYFDNHKSEYYFHLEKNTRNTEKFINFFLKAVTWSLERILVDIKNLENDETNQNSENDDKSLTLLPRRKEILNIITDHPYISLNAIARRFPTIANRTIAYDVQQLIKNKLVNKHGQTRGVMYTAKNESF